MNQIGIEQVLQKLNDTVDVETNEVKSYGIQFLSEKSAQVVCREMVVRKRTKGPKQIVLGEDANGRGRYNLQANGLVAVIDLDSDQPKSITVALIYGFRDFKSQTWIKVFH